MRMPDDIEKCPACGREGYDPRHNVWLCPYIDCATGEMQLCWDNDRHLWLEELWLIVNENGHIVLLREEYC